MTAEEAEVPPAGATSFHLRRAREGDRDSLDQAVRRISPLLLAQARYRLKALSRRTMEPEDLVAETWLRALPHLRKLEPRAGRLTPVVLSYLVMTLKRRAKDLLVAQLRRASPGAAIEPEPVDWLPADTGQVVSRAIQEEASAALHGAIAALGSRDREIFVLRALEATPMREIAEIVGMSEDAVKKRYYRTFRKLKESLTGSVLDELEP